MLPLADPDLLATNEELDAEWQHLLQLHGEDGQALGQGPAPSEESPASARGEP